MSTTKQGVQYGGSWFSASHCLHSAYRNSYYKSDSYLDVGFHIKLRKVK